MAQGSNSNEGEVIFQLDDETDKTHKDTLYVLLYNVLFLLPLIPLLRQILVAVICSKTHQTAE